jgi:ATP-dependent Lon protease
MSLIDDFSFSAADFTGTVRLFPLPNLVLFPHVMQPLHVLEPRYRELLEESLAADRLVTMAMLARGWERDYEGRPPLVPVACLGRVAVHHRLEDGAYNVLLVGLKRVRLLEELPARKSFREARVVICEDAYPPDEAATTAVLQRKLRNAFLQVLPDLPQAQDQLEQLLSSDISLGTLTDIIGYMLEIDPAGKETLLGEPNVHRRTELLLEHLSTAARSGEAGVAGVMAFPPEFSVN